MEVKVCKELDVWVKPEPLTYGDAGVPGENPPGTELATGIPEIIVDAVVAAKPAMTAPFHCCRILQRDAICRPLDPTG